MAENKDLDFSGLFYDSATVTFDTPGKVQANAIAVLSGGSVSSVTIDQPATFGTWQRQAPGSIRFGGMAAAFHPKPGCCHVYSCC